jgi:hypothetical protein
MQVPWRQNVRGRQMSPGQQGWPTRPQSGGRGWHVPSSQRLPERQAAPPPSQHGRPTMPQVRESHTPATQEKPGRQLWPAQQFSCSAPQDTAPTTRRHRPTATQL